MSVLDARWSITVCGSFEASHVLEGSERCYRDHGHSWSAEVRLESAEMENDGLPRGGAELEHHWKVLLAELDLRPLDKMLPGVVTTPLGIANWLFERITANYPGVMAVRVSDGTIWGEKSRR